ncbi:MFS general substrate transporter [Corynespora cassiicola Philippines]|uniref:MFS general substrate transporter n=1 Tax=Corynespora cassiicola Philippines TaxID=1448308 RepID=A0A2T2N254_CORCC|nr:MFS general substrate transporter [Corynespora cassiicola Philippines]
MPQSSEILPVHESPITKEVDRLPHCPGNHELYSNFSAATRIYITYFLGFVMILSTLTATIYFPLIPTLSLHFGVSIQAINLTVTVYAVCQAVSPTIFASLADSYGRRPVLLALVLIYALGSLGLTLNKKSYAALMLLRAVQSFGGSAIPSVAYGVVADLLPPSERGRMLGPMLATCNGISAVGPVIGGALAMQTGAHTWVFFALLVISVLCFLMVGFTFPETAREVAGNGLRAVHGIRRTWVDVLRTNKRSQQSIASDSHQVEGKQLGFWQGFWRLMDSIRIFRHPDAAVILWMIAASYGIYYTFQVAIPVIFDDIYGYNEFQIGLAFLPGLAGMTIGGIIAGKLMDINYTKEAEKEGIKISKNDEVDYTSFPLEKARYRMILPFICAEMALVAGYGWIVQRRIHAAVPIVFQFLICALSTLLSHTASALLVDVFPDMPSTAYASGQLARCGFSAGSAAVIEPLEDSVGRGWYFTMFSLLTGLSCIICVALSQWKGQEWRQKRHSKPQE